MCWKVTFTLNNNMNRNEIITDIGERLTDAIYELNDSFEWDYCEESGSRSHSCTACIKYGLGVIS